MAIRILGISAYYHDSAACLVEDGRIVAAAQEERFTRKKHDAGFPSRAVEYCLREAGIGVDQLDLVGFYEKPIVKFSRLIETYIACAPRGLKSYLTALPLWLSEKLWMSDDIRSHLEDAANGVAYEGEILFGEHHESHAASAFYPSPFEQAAIVTMDGVGEWATSSIGAGRGNDIELLRELRFPHSLGLLYSAFTYFTGFRVNSGEYKVMGLAPYGEPKYVKLIKDHLIEIRVDGSLWMNMEYFTYPSGLTMTGGALDRLMGGPARQPESKLTQREMDLARSIQDITEEVMLKMTAFAHRETGLRDLCLAGGVALNCVGNGRILRDGPFDQIWIQPAAGDAGGSLGVAMALWHRHLEKPRISPESAGTWERPSRSERPPQPVGRVLLDPADRRVPKDPPYRLRRSFPCACPFRTEPRFFQMPVPQRQRDAKGSARIARGRLDPDLIERPVAKDPAVADAVERHAAGQAQIAQTGFAMRECSHLEHHFFSDVLNRPREIHLPLRQLGFRLPARPAHQPLQRTARHRESAGVREVLHVHPQAAIVPDLDQVIFDELDVFRLAVRCEAHHLVLARIHLEAGEVSESRVQQPERVWKAKLSQQLNLIPAPGANRRGRPLADAVHGHDRGLFEG